MNQHLRSLARRVRQGVRKVWPRPKGDLRNYRNDFGDTALAFERFIAKCLPLPQPEVGPPAAVVVSPWVGTPQPWYAIAIAIGLTRRGRPVTLIWDDTSLPEAPDYLATQNEAIGRVMRQLASHMPTVTLSQEAPQPVDAADEEEITRLARLIMIWRLRAAPFAPKDLAEGDRIARIMRDTLGRIKGLLARSPFAYVVVGNGIIGSSGLFLWASLQAKVRASTFDANIGVMQISTYGLAAQQSDLPSAFVEVLKWDAATRGRAVREARRQFERRVQAKDKARYQVAAPNRAAALGFRVPFVLLALNIEHDSAALGRHRAFADSAEWIVAVIDFVLKHNSTVSVVVRQHPAERNPFERSRFPIRSLLQEHFPDEPRLRFIAAEDPVNTYDLVEQAVVVLPYVSTIGIEAAALGKPVLVAGDSCYSDLEFVWTAPSRERYLELLGRGLRDELGLLPDQVEKAWLCYYLTPVCNRIWTHFSPQPPDFWRWQRRSPARLYADAAVSDILTAIDQNVPAALVRHNRSLHA